ncbi:membrane protein [Desulfurobacterium pacificum]|uniref:Membrane protein n=1 Tax=Desulfurobacterium pacificum TaxID=240166 RepID=A0ABY1NPW7_9BACT|nr:YihY/virulence factor BrkB family protein [Desulfurobacterium pacificum]SMP14375.1 membrane protein [Desulfurobacterium pacificum]
MICKRLLKKGSFSRYLLFSVCDLFESDYQFFAASIAYYTLMSVIPLFIFLFFLGMMVFHVDFKSFIPPEIINSPLKPIFLQIEDVINDSGIISGTAALIMLWFSRGIFLSIEKSFCEILDKTNPAGFFYKHIVTILVIFFLWILMLVFYVVKYLIAVLMPKLPILSLFTSIAVPILVFVFIFSIYYFLLPVKVSGRFVMKVTLIVFILLAVFEKVFIWFIFNLSKVSILYGSFAAIVVFLLWIYYSATVLLLGVGIIKAKMLAEEM